MAAKRTLRGGVARQTRITSSSSSRTNTTTTTTGRSPSAAAATGRSGIRDRTNTAERGEGESSVVSVKPTKTQGKRKKNQGKRKRKKTRCANKECNEKFPIPGVTFGRVGKHFAKKPKHGWYCGKCRPGGRGLYARVSLARTREWTPPAEKVGGVYIANLAGAESFTEWAPPSCSGGDLLWVNLNPPKTSGDTALGKAAPPYPARSNAGIGFERRVREVQGLERQWRSVASWEITYRSKSRWDDISLNEGHAHALFAKLVEDIRVWLDEAGEDEPPRTILVNCQKGQNRSATLVIALVRAVVGGGATALLRHRAFRGARSRGMGPTGAQGEQERRGAEAVGSSLRETCGAETRPTPAQALEHVRLCVSHVRLKVYRQSNTTAQLRFVKIAFGACDKTWMEKVHSDAIAGPSCSRRGHRKSAFTIAAERGEVSLPDTGGYWARILPLPVGQQGYEAIEEGMWDGHHLYKTLSEGARGDDEDSD